MDVDVQLIGQGQVEHTHTHTNTQLEECQHLIGKTEAKVSYFGSSQRQHNPFIDAFYFTVAKIGVKSE